ncbi:MAG: trehalose 6-phosphate synthase/phosphatase [Roseivirga sp.]|jgi:trehalose 6-phosphate synthase/phosphatase
MPKTIIVSNRLPVRIEKDPEGQLEFKNSEGGLATGLGSIYRQGENIWLGWPGAAIEEESQKKRVIQKLKEESMHPVFLSPDEVENFYLGFSNQTLWPAFHYFVQYIQYSDKYWEAYQRVNEKFAAEILSILEPGDTIWVHDYQLLLLPELLRKQHPECSIGFFNHIPFPSYEIFRMIPWRKELLNGMLGADYLAFHTYDDTRHFLSSCHRLAGIPYEGNQLKVGNRLVVVDALPMGIDYDKFEEVASENATIAHLDEFKKNIKSERVILSVDRLDYSKGIVKRLKTLDRFFAKYPEYIGKISLLLVVVPSRDQVPSYKALKEEVDEWVGRINGRYSTMDYSPIYYFYRSFPINELSAFYRLCDIAMITPLRDGMNLVCKEYIASRIHKKGVLILSEMAGAAKELSDAILVNPNNRDQMVESIHTALNMWEDEQEQRMEIMQRTLKTYNIFNWVNLFLSNLEQVKQQQKSGLIEKLVGKVRNAMHERYHKASKRLLFLDYDGTLVGFHENPEKSVPSKKLKSIIEKLTSDPKNTVFVVSGRDRLFLKKQMDEFNLRLVAEHGVWIENEDGTFTNRLKDSSADWKISVREIMTFYVDRTPGTFIEEKEHAMVWHYRKAESGLGEIRVRELSSHLKHFLTDKGLTVMNGNMIVEVKPKEVNKGQAVSFLSQQIAHDFVMAIGDDLTDEDMFEALEQEAYTIKVGPGNSAARFGLVDFKEVTSLLDELSKI